MWLKKGSSAEIPHLGREREMAQDPKLKGMLSFHQLPVGEKKNLNICMVKLKIEIQTLIPMMINYKFYRKNSGRMRVKKSSHENNYGVIVFNGNILLENLK